MIDLNTCPCSGRNLDKLVKPAVLMLLAGEDLHGYEIVQRLAQLPTFHGAKPNATGVYRALRAMDQDGLLSAAWELSESGPAKRRYRMTEDGHACTRRWVESLRAYHAAVGSLLTTAEQTLATQGRSSGRERRKGRRDRTG